MTVSSKSDQGQGRAAVYICNAKRSPIGSFMGALSAVPVTELGAQILQAVLADSGIKADLVNEVILGCVLSAGVGQAPARQCSVAAGLPKSTQAMTINKVCSSGLKAVMLAANSVQLGQADAVLAGGMENMSASPYLLTRLRAGARLGHTEAEDSIIRDALWDVYNDFHMGNAAEVCAEKFSLSREMQDKFAIESYRRANEAIANAHFDQEIAAISVKSRKETVAFSIDEEPAKGNPAKMPKLKTVFQKDGTVTAANASSINDGAAAMLVCSEDFVKQNNLKPLARILAQGWHAQEPEWFTTAPITAANNALAQANLKIDDIDLFEINEAFSAVALACGGELKIDPANLNVSGGAVALGHPVGASGARILTTLLYGLKRLSLKRGLAAICNGGGEATALIVERV